MHVGPLSSANGKSSSTDNTGVVVRGRGPLESCSGFMRSVSQRPNDTKLNPSMCKVRFNVAAFTVALLATPLLGSSNPPTWRDTGNRTLVFHGVNVVHKGFPYIPITSHFDSNFSFAAEDVTFLRSIGCNAIRLGVIWAGAQPLPPPSERAPAPFNVSYFDELERVVAIAAAGGISVLLDVHQDLYSAAFCGEGAPLWAADASNASGALPFPEPIGAAFGPDDYDAEGVPTDAACSRHPWQNYQLAHGSAVAYQRLYTHPPLRAAYAAFLQEIARRFKGNHAVLGLEIINEPFAGDVYKDPALFLPGVADKVNLAPFYDEVAAAIRVADPSASIFFESVTWDDIVCGFDHVPGGSERGVLSYHYYHPPNLSPREALQHQMHECARLSCRCFMTEFSLPLHGMPPQAGLADTAASFIAAAEAADAHAQSWLGWQYKPFKRITGWGLSLWNEDGSLNATTAQLVARTYAQAVAGDIMEMSFDNSTSVFHLAYLCNSALPTELYLSQRFRYPHGFNITVTPTSSCKISQPESNAVHVTCAAGDSVQVLIEALPDSGR